MSQRPACLDGEKPHRAHSGSDDEASAPRDSGPAEPMKDESGSRFILLMTVAALALGMFLVSLDMTIVATAIPQIVDEFGQIELVGWYGAAFFTTLGGFQAAWGKAYKYFPLKTTFLLSILLFGVGSLICGISPNSLALIIGRAITGVGGAGISCGCFTIIALSAPEKQRPAYIGILGASYGIAAAIGPLVGGAFTDRVTWRWCFYINLPIGGAAGAVILFFYKPPPPLPTLKESLREKLLQMDLPGTLLLTSALVCYVLSLQWAGVSRPWSDSTVIGTLVGFGVLLLAYVCVQWLQGERAAMVGHLFDRNVIIAMVYIHLIAGSFFLLVYYLPIYFQVVSGVSAAESGVRNLPLILAQSLFSTLSGVLLSKVQRPQPFLIAGGVFVAIASGLLFTLDVDTTAGKWIGYQLMAGVGVGWCFQVPVVTAQSAVEPTHVSSVTAMVLTVQTLGGSIFVSAGQSALDNILFKSLPDGFSAADIAAVANTGATKLRETVSEERMPMVLGAYMNGIKGTFLIAIIASSLATVASAALRPTKLGSSTSAAPA